MDRAIFDRQIDGIYAAVRSRDTEEALKLARDAYGEAFSRYTELLGQKRVLMAGPSNNFTSHQKIDVNRAIIDITQYLARLSDMIDNYDWENNDKGGTR